MKDHEICRERRFCAGCEACANVCPQKAIIMKADWRGFKYPHISSELCIDCGLCQKTCPINEKEKHPFVFGEARAFVEKNSLYLARASSGGAFGVLARYVISQNGIVFGATMDDEYNVYYIGVESLEDLPLLHGSKYVQSYVNDIYSQVKSALTAGREVLFCGCPCQVVGLKNFLKKTYDNLITMDLICHGVPSQPYFKSYVRDLLKHKLKLGFKSFRFRWKPIENELVNDLYIGFRQKDYYMTYFLWGKGYRPSCYRCRFAGGERQGDFTIGDFWNNKVAKLPIDDTQGASLILLNTPKAKALEGLFKANGYYYKVPTLKDAVSGDGGQLKHPSQYDIRCDLIYVLYKILGVRGPKLLFKLECFRMKR